MGGIIELGNRLYCAAQAVVNTSDSVSGKYSSCMKAARAEDTGNGNKGPADSAQGQIDTYAPTLQADTQNTDVNKGAPKQDGKPESPGRPTNERKYVMGAIFDPNDRELH
jgi:hypothetical protein